MWRVGRGNEDGVETKTYSQSCQLLEVLRVNKLL